MVGQLRQGDVQRAGYVPRTRRWWIGAAHHQTLLPDLVSVGVTPKTEPSGSVSGEGATQQVMSGFADAYRADLPVALASVRPALQDERDRALATDLVTGTLRWQGQLDHLIEHFARRPVTKLDFEVLQILRLGAYQLLHLDRVPAAAARSSRRPWSEPSIAWSATGCA